MAVVYCRKCEYRHEGVGDLPPRCPGCFQRAQWSTVLIPVYVPDVVPSSSAHVYALTHNDRLLLKRFSIKVDE